MKKVILTILFFSFFFPVVASSAVSENRIVVPLSGLNRHVDSRGYLQKGAFKYKKNAEVYSRKLRREGFDVSVVRSVTSHHTGVYRVLARKTVVPAGKLDRRADRPGYLQKGAFRQKKNAALYSRKLRHEGFKVFIVRGTTSDHMQVYRVLARKTAERSGIYRFGEAKPVKHFAGVKRHAVGENRGLEKRSEPPAVDGQSPAGDAPAVRESSVGHPTAASASSAGISSAGGTGFPKGSFLVSEAGDSGVPETRQREEGPAGTLRSYRDIFGRGGSYFHPSLAVAEIYTDNAYATKDNKKTNLTTMLTPEVWLSLPRVAQRRLVLDETWTRMPGGLVFTRYNPEVIRRYQAYILYRADIPLPSANSPYRGTISHTGYGRFEYNGNKFSGDISDLFLKSFETRGVSVSTPAGQIDKYYDNLFDVTAHVNTGNRLRVQLDYSNFLIHYNDDRNSFMDRTDNSFSGYLFYKVKPKTAAFVEYRFIDISYLNDSSLDSNEHHFLAGVQWDITAKSRGTVKAGYGIKDFAGSSQNAHTFMAEAQIKHQFTPRTSLTLTGFRKTDETNVETFLYTITNQIGVEYQQLVTSKITGLADLMYINEKYKGSAASGGDTSDIENNVYQATVGLQYEFQKWLSSTVGYVYTKRDSSFSAYDFASNTAFFRITASL